MIWVEVVGIVFGGFCCFVFWLGGDGDGSLDEIVGVYGCVEDVVDCDVV